MSSYIQLVSLAFSFLYGAFFYLLARFNKYILINKNVFIKFIISFVFVIDAVILYIYLMFKINNGYFHGYFLFMILLGFATIYKLYYVIENWCKINVKKLKRTK